MGKEADTPQAPDYGSLARQQSALQQGAANQQTWANRVNQVGPQGSVTWTNSPVNQRQFDADAYAAALDAYSKGQQGQKPQVQGIGATGNGLSGYGDSAPGVVPQQQQQNVPGMPNREDFYRDMPMDQWTQTTTLSPEMQAQLDQQNALRQGLLGQAQNSLQNPLDMSGLPGLHQIDMNGLPAMPDSGFGAVQEVQDAMMGRLGSGLQQGRDAEIQRLKAQGITEGTPAWQAAMQSLNQKDIDANQQALLGAMGAYNDIFNRGMSARKEGFSEQNQLYGNSVTDRANALKEMLTQRQNPLNEYAALIGGGGVQNPQFPGYTQATPWQSPDVMGAANQQYNAAVANANAQNASSGNMLGGLLGLAGSIFGGPIGGAIGGMFGGTMGK